MYTCVRDEHTHTHTQSHKSLVVGVVSDAPSTHDHRCKCLYLYLFTDRCKNCRIPCCGRLCLSCASKRKCRNCGRHLVNGLYENDTSTTCKTCVRKLTKRTVHVTRTAFNGLLQEVPLPVNSNDVGDLNAYITNRRDDIENILQSAVEEDE